MNLNYINARVRSIAQGLTYNEGPREAEAKRRLYTLLSQLSDGVPAAPPIAEGNPAGTPGSKVDASRLTESAPSGKCIYPICTCPFDAPADPNWCARGLPR